MKLSVSFLWQERRSKTAETRRTCGKGLWVTAKGFSAQKQRQIAHRGLLSSDISHQPSVGLKVNWEERFVGVSVFSLVKKVFRAQELTKKPFVATSATKKLSKLKYKPTEVTF